MMLGTSRIINAIIFLHSKNNIGTQPPQSLTSDRVKYRWNNDCRNNYYDQVYCHLRYKYSCDSFGTLRMQAKVSVIELVAILFFWTF